MCDNTGDVESLAVIHRIMNCSDLVAAEGRCHKKCRDTVNFDSKSAKSIIDKKRKTLKYRTTSKF